MNETPDLIPTAASEPSVGALVPQAASVPARDGNADSLMRIIEAAMNRADFDVDKVTRLLDVKERWEANEARKAFAVAMAGFKAEPVEILKDKHVFFKGKDGKPDTSYWHSTLANVVATLSPLLAKHKLSHRWHVERDGDRVLVTCILMHAAGHSETIMLPGPLDQSGSKNNLQAVGSSITYLQRYTLLSITGCATADQDDDGDAGGAGAVDVLAREIHDGLIEELHGTKTDSAAAAVWTTGSKALAATKNTDAYKSFKNAVIAHRQELKTQGGAK